MADPAAGLARLALLAERAPGPEASGWATRAATPDGEHVLLGTGLRADAPAALLWNGARLHRHGAHATDRLLLLALVGAGVPLDRAEVDDGIRRAVARGARLIGPAAAPAAAVAVVGDEVLAAAATAAEVAGLGEDLDAALGDLAACLAVVGPPGPATGDDLRAGHALVAGWLAVRLHAAGATAPDGTAQRTVSTLAGTP